MCTYTGERNYHIFYQLLAAIAAKDSILLGEGQTGQLQPNTNLNLTSDITNYRILNTTHQPHTNSIYNTSTTTNSNNSDYIQFKETYASLQSLGLTEPEIQGVFMTLAGILHLGLTNIILCLYMFIIRVNIYIYGSYVTIYDLYAYTHRI